MLKANAQISAPAEAPQPSGTKKRIIEAALETLKNEGFAGTSARSIARRGDFNQALVFYHFGNINNLLLAALDETSRGRMNAYRAALEGALTPQELVEVALDGYREDLASGHITVLTEMIAGSLANPELKQAIVARMEPWVDFAEAALTKALDGFPFAAIVPVRELAYGVVALYLGVEMLAHLEVEPHRVDALFATARSLSALAVPLMGGG
jgi:AcrR family transcriptional regulator